MGKTYLAAPPEAMDTLASLLSEYFPHIASLERRMEIRLQFVLGDEEGGPALTKGGWPCEALVTKVPLKMRAAGGPDVLIEVDGDRWSQLDERAQRALLHHELHHVEPVDWKECTNHDGEVFYTCRLDALGRPMVRLRLHDYECGGFAAVHEIYGDDSPESRQMEYAHGRLAQQMLPFAKAV